LQQFSQAFPFILSVKGRHCVTNETYLINIILFYFVTCFSILDHLIWFRCERCRFAKFPTEYALISHCKNDHELKEFFVSYCSYRLRRFLSVPIFFILPLSLTVEPAVSSSEHVGVMQSSSGSSAISYVVSSDECCVCSAFNNECKPSSPFQPKDAVICQICGLKVSNQRSSLVYHANTKHIKLNLYQCAVCQKTWQTIAKSDVLKHVKVHHTYYRRSTTLRMFTARCFPPKPSPLACEPSA
uniref:C2H2-type domain-containing protein n=1 Tax=Angiostrongylus costaricensis TaxID=334426 RepID=A0A158PJE2_ANGCS